MQPYQFDNPEKELPVLQSRCLFFLPVNLHPNQLLLHQL